MTKATNWQIDDLIVQLLVANEIEISDTNINGIKVYLGLIKLNKVAADLKSQVYKIDPKRYFKEEGKCNYCGRITCDKSMVGMICGIPKPNGKKCKGMFKSVR